MTFSQPVGGDTFPMGEHVDHLVIYAPLEHIPEITTTFGVKDAVRATIVCVDCDEEFEDALVFAGRLIRVTKNRIGELVLGRLGQRPGKAGQNPAWTLEPFADEDAARAMAAWDAYTARAEQPEPEAEPAPVAATTQRSNTAATSKSRDVAALRAAAGAKVG